MQRLQITVCTALLAIGLIATLSSSRADSYSYATQRRVVRVGMLMTNATAIANRRNGSSGSYSENPDPGFFYILDRRVDLKPAGMEILNPLAPAVITPEIYQRWYDRQNGGDPAFQAGTPQSKAFQVGAKVTKNMGSYWEVNLENITMEDMRQFDLLYIHSHMAKCSFTPDERQKLTKFIEGGGTLWVENCGGFSFDPNSPFLLDIAMTSGGPGNGSGAIAATNHPLMTSPYVLTTQEVQVLGDKGVGGYYIYQGAAAPGIMPGSQTLIPIVWNNRGFAGPGNGNPDPNWRPYIMAGQIGAGRYIVSAQDSGCAINDYALGGNAGYGGNSTVISGEVISAAHTPDLKFVYNMLTWASASTTANGDVRRTGNSTENLGSSLTDKYIVSDTLQGKMPGTANVSSAALANHCIFSVDGNLILHSYNTYPAEDLDGDGNPDDGIVDYGRGLPYDEIWNFDLKTVAGNATGASAPTLISFLDMTPPGNNKGLMDYAMRDLVVVTLSDGSIVALRAFPRLAAPGTPLAPFTVVDWAIPGGSGFTLPSGTPVPSVAWSEGVIFAAVPTAAGAYVAAIDPRNGKGAFAPYAAAPASDPVKSSVPVAPIDPSSMITSSPTVGYVKDNTFGAMDKMVYVTVPSYTVNTTPAISWPASVRAFWFGTKGDPLTLPAPLGAVFSCRPVRPPSGLGWYQIDPAAPLNGNTLLRPRVFMTHRDVNNNVTASRELAFTVNPPGADEFTINNGSTVIIGITVAGFAPNDAGNSFTADYTLNWPDTANSLLAQRRILGVPDPLSKGNVVGGTPCLSPEDYLFYTVDTTLTGGLNPGRGVLMAVNEQKAATLLKWSYVMHDGYTITVNSQPVNISPRLQQYDPNLGLNTNVPITNVQFYGTPAWKNGIVYATASGSVSGKLVSMLMAFKSNPNIILRLNQAIPQGTPITITQYNPVLQSDNTTPARVDLLPSQYTIDSDTGLVSINSMASPGTVNNFVSASLPFIVKIGATGTETVINSAPGDQDNLLWYMVFPTFLPQPKAASMPLVVNPALGVISSAPMIQGESIWLAFSGGQVAAVDADPTATDPTAASRNGQAPIFTIGSVIGHVTWIQDVSAKIPGDAGPILGSPVGTSGQLMVNTVDGLRVYEDSITVIADGSRLLEVNSAGEAIWNTTGTQSYNIAGGELPKYLGFDPNNNDFGQPINPLTDTGLTMIQKIPFSHPAVVRVAPSKNYVVVDTGNNRVVQIDHGSNIVWEITTFTDPDKRLIPGEPLTLSEPTDCTFWSTANANGSVYTMHCVIADSGNSRIIELVNQFQVNQPDPVSPWKVVYVSKTVTLGKRYRFRTAERIWNYDLANPANPPVQYTLATVSNLRVAGDTGVGLTMNKDDAETGGGAVMVLDVNGLPTFVTSNLLVPDPAGKVTVGNVKYRLQPILNPTSFTKFDEQVAPNKIVYHYLLTDANGCYQFKVDPTDLTRLLVEWMLTADDYRHMTGKQLKAVSIRHLAKLATGAAPGGLHQFLITNGYSGLDDPTVFGAPASLQSEFHGEAFVLDPQGFDIMQPLNWHGYRQDYIVQNGQLVRNSTPSIVWRSPTEMVVNGAIHRSIGYELRGTSSSPLEQPGCAERL